MGGEGVGGLIPPPTTHAGSCMRACGLPQLFMSVLLPQRTTKSLYYEESAWIKMGKGLDAICLLHTLLQTPASYYWSLVKLYSVRHVTGMVRIT